MTLRIRHALLIAYRAPVPAIMYAPTYGYGPTPNSSSPSPFNPNGGPLQPHNHPHQQQQQHHQQAQHQQQPQPMMYSTQAYGAAHQSPYGVPGMGGNAGGMPMMQNSGLAHMPGGGMFVLISPSFTLSILLQTSHTCACLEIYAVF